MMRVVELYGGGMTRRKEALNRRDQLSSFFLRIRRIHIGF